MCAARRSRQRRKPSMANGVNFSDPSGSFARITVSGRPAVARGARGNQVRRGGFMDSFKSQIVQVLRRLRRAPMFTVITLITLAAGVGANIAIFSVVESVLIKPLPYPNADELVAVWHTAPGIGIKELNASPSTYFVYRDQSNTFQDVGLYSGDSVNVTGVAEPEQVQALLVTEGTLPILGVPPMLGRWFTAG